MSNNVTETLLEEWSDETWDLSDFLELLNQIPEALRPSAQVVFSTGEFSASLRVTYLRPETDAERDYRLQWEQVRAERRARYDAQAAIQERAQYEALKRKYEP